MLNKSQIKYQSILYGLIIIFILSSYTALGMGEPVLSRTIREDQYFEILGAVGFFITAIFFLLSLIKLLKDIKKNGTPKLILVIYFFLFTLFIFGAGEEISWGQRIFNIKTPDALTQVNRQEELNLHNLKIINSGQYISANRIFDIFWFSYTIILPLSYLFWRRFRSLIDSKFGAFTPIPHWSLGVLFFLNYIWAKIVKILFESTYNYEVISFTQAVQEIKESNYGFLFIFVGLYIFLLVNRSLQKKH